MDLAAIQQQINAEGLDGWLFYDHHVRDPIAYRILNLDSKAHVSRRWYYWIPSSGTPRKLVHAIEPARLDSLPGSRDLYSSWRSHRTGLAEMLAGARLVAMQFSPDCMIPVVSLVDAGTVDLIRSLGVQVVSSAALVQYFEARWTPRQQELHVEAGRRVDRVLRDAFRRIRDDIDRQGASSEDAIARHILDGFRDRDMVTMDSPIVAVNSNSGDPHYSPRPSRARPIRDGDFVLIDLWAKLNTPDGVYYDITWTGFCGSTPPDPIRAVFEIVTEARDKTLAFVQQARLSGERIKGWQVDDIARNHITAAGFGDAFVHRTGHSIGKEVHGNGANMDNLETRDERPVIPGTCFSIEPGIYLPDFGVRTEINCLVTADGARATGAVQKEIVRI